MFHNAFYSGDIDTTELIFGTFVLFFIGLILYLRREDRREGYPLEDDVSGRLEPVGGLLFFPKPKTFRLPHGHGLLTVPTGKRDARPTSAARTSGAPGTPLEPTGNPLTAGVGPGAFAERAREPDLTAHGDPKIVPMRVATDFSVVGGEADPRGMTVSGADGAKAGVVTDLWVDRAEHLIRYLEVAVEAGGAKVLVPMTMAKVDRGAHKVRVDALLAGQFAGAPGLANPDQVTLYEEERIVAYFGAGFLYATPARSEPLL